MKSITGSQSVPFKKVKLLLTLVIAIFIMSSSSWATTYYASPTGGADGSSESKPFKVSSFWNVAKPGDILYLLDGNYTDANSMITPPATVDGISGNPITIKALNEGNVLIDGVTTGKPVYLYQNDYLDLEGFNACNGGTANQGRVLWIRDSQNVNVKKIVGWDGDPNENGCIFFVGASTDVLIEDCAGWGPARKIFGRYNEDHTTFRRCFFRWTNQNEQNPYCIGMTASYGSTNTIIENCIGTWDETGYTASNIFRDSIFGVDQTSSTGGYKILGNIAYHFSSQQGQPARLFNVEQTDVNTNYIIKDCVAYTDKEDISPFHLTNLVFNGSYLTSIGGGYSPHDIAAVNVNKQSGTVNFCIVQNSSKVGILDGSAFDYLMVYNNKIKNFATGTPLNYLDQNPDLIGRAKNIFQYNLPEEERPKINGQSVGAKIQYRYVNGVLTDEPLWPWLMNDRIKDAMVKSGYEKKGGLDGKGGIDLTKTIFELSGGTMPSSFDGSPLLPPPAGLKVQ